jgi:hypothetical protein
MTENQAALRGLWLALTVPWVVIVMLGASAIAYRSPDLIHATAGFAAIIAFAPPFCVLALARAISRSSKPKPDEGAQRRR